MTHGGTGHAIMSCIDVIDGPFAVINADDYYGRHAFKMAYDFLTENQDKDGVYQYVMVGYKLEEHSHRQWPCSPRCVRDRRGRISEGYQQAHSY